MRYLIALWCVLAVGCLTALGQSGGAGVDALVGVGVDQKLGGVVPMDAAFVDESGKLVTLRDCFHGRPVLLTPVYYECPMLCTVTLNQLGRTVNAMKESVGEEFDIVTFSINPKETPELARRKKASQLAAYRRPTAEAGWKFLTGSEASTRQLTETIGFRYRWDQASQQYIHAGALVVLTPDGRVSRYFLGVDYPPTELEAALTKARSGTISGAVEPVLLYCFRYDPATGKYGLIISRALKVMGVVLIGGLVTMMVVLTRRSSARHIQVTAAAPGEGGAS